MRVLVTGGTGYIGSHTAVELISDGHEVFIIDSLENSSIAALQAIKQLTGTEPTFLNANVQDREKLRAFLKEHTIEAIIHFAAYKAVGESAAKPLRYYDNNVYSFICLLQEALESGVSNIVFSSTAAVYGNPPVDQVTEETPCAPESPYGWSKRMSEIILADSCRVNPSLQGTVLRYFNVVGAHPSGLLGESTTKPQNLLPLIVQAVAGQTPPLTVFGTDYPTKDGTCLRDYIHVVDLARAHIAALKHHEQRQFNYDIYNIGTGKPTSVLELIETFQKINHVTVPYDVGDRRAGDPVSYYASSAKAEKQLHWHAEQTIEDAVHDAWQWHLQEHPRAD
jgi:UDP-glucose 4-epimerase